MVTPSHPHTLTHSQDLIALKQLESYKVLECEELQGSNMAAVGDDFTVATALEDLEFGFSIVQSSQKVCHVIVM